MFYSYYYLDNERGDEFNCEPYETLQVDTKNTHVELFIVCVYRSSIRKEVIYPMKA